MKKLQKQFKFFFSFCCFMKQFLASSEARKNFAQFQKRAREETSGKGTN